MEYKFNIEYFILFLIELDIEYYTEDIAVIVYLYIDIYSIYRRYSRSNEYDDNFYTQPYFYPFYCIPVL